MPKDPVEVFAEVARSYCELIESHEGRPRAGFVNDCRKALVHLYAAGLDLPEVEFVSSAPSELEEQGWSALNRSLGVMLGDWNTYSEVFDPYDPAEPVHGLLSDDLADIYIDLKRGFRLFEMADGPGKLWAVWDWRFHFHVHWGEHLSGALRPLHALLDQEWQASELGQDGGT